MCQLLVLSLALQLQQFLEIVNFTLQFVDQCVIFSTDLILVDALHYLTCSVRELYRAYALLHVVVGG